MGQQVFQEGDRGQRFFVLVLDLLALERRQPPQLQVEDRLGLDFRELEALHQARPGGVHVLRLANGLDHLVQVGQGGEQPFQNVGPRRALASSNCERRVMTT